jgi:hypothetical protein
MYSELLGNLKRRDHLEQLSADGESVEFPDQLCVYQFLKKDTATWSYYVLHLTTFCNSILDNRNFGKTIPHGYLGYYYV